MKKLFIFFFLSIFFVNCTPSPQAQSGRKVLVSIGPDKFFAEQIAGSEVRIELIVPPGASPHFYEPSPRDSARLVDADIWFRRGEPFEAKLATSLKQATPDLKLIDLRDDIHLLEGTCHHEHGHGDHHHHHHGDPHTWTSPKNAILHVERIRNELQALIPEKQALFAENAEALIQKLKRYDLAIHQALHALPKRKVIVSHPALAYFCSDYHLEQLSVEHEGKEPPPRYLNQLLEEAKKGDVAHIFLQQQYNNKGGELIAKYLNLPASHIDPYSEDYLSFLKEVTETLTHEALNCDD